MTDTQPTALWLADALEDAGMPTFITDEAAAVLRRQHEENQRLSMFLNRAGHLTIALDRIAALEKAGRQALEALERYAVKRQDFDRFADETTALRQALGDKHD